MTNLMNEPKVYTIEEAAEVLQVAVHTMYRLVKEKQIPTVNLGARLTRIKADHLNDWLDKQKT